MRLTTLPVLIAHSTRRRLSALVCTTAQRGRRRSRHVRLCRHGVVIGWDASCMQSSEWLRAQAAGKSEAEVRCADTLSNRVNSSGSRAYSDSRVPAAAPRAVRPPAVRNRQSALGDLPRVCRRRHAVLAALPTRSGEHGGHAASNRRDHRRRAVPATRAIELRERGHRGLHDDSSRPTGRTAPDRDRFGNGCRSPVRGQ